MKSLVQFLAEQKNASANEENIFTFNFTGMDDKDDVLKELGEQDCAKVEGDMVTLTAKRDCDCCEDVLKIVKKYSDAQRQSQHRSSDEQYAQKTVAFKSAVDALDDFLHTEPEEPEKEEEKEAEKEEKK